LIQSIAAAVVTALVIIASVVAWVAYVLRYQPTSTASRVVKGAEAFVIRAAETVKSAYRNNKAIWLLPTRGSIPLQVYVSLRNMHLMMNQPRACVEITKKEVGAAYEEGVAMILSDPNTASFPWIWTYEEDNIQPPDVFFKLFNAIWKCIDCGEDMPSDATGGPVDPWVCPNGHKGLDAVAGLYRTKSEPSWSMAFGDPKSEKLEFRPREITPEMERDGVVLEVNGVAQGCTLFRKAMFKDIPRPWFKTLSGSEPEQAGAYTQDLYFSRKAKEAGMRFAVHCGVSVGHLDIESGRVF